LALIESLHRDGIALGKRVQKALHTLDYAAGPAARAAAAEALQAVLLEQQSNSCAQELDPARLAQELVRTAEPALDEARLFFEQQAEVNRAYFPPFVQTTEEEKRRMREEAARAPSESSAAKRSGDESFRNFGPDIIVVPFINGGFDQNVLKALRARGIALKGAHAETHALKLLPLTREEVAHKIERLKATIPPVPAGASLNAFPVEGYEPPKHLPAPPDNVVYVDGVAQ
jgi:hypothetical protein